MNNEQKINELEAQYLALKEQIQSLEEEESVFDLDIDRANSYYDILHMMGKYASYHYYAEHRTTYEYFSKQPGTTAELSATGVYADLDKIYQMFLCYHEQNNLPGTMHLHPLSTPYIQVAGDGKTASFYMFTNGLEALPSPPDQPPFCMWFYDAYCNDCVKEEDGWKWTRFHLMDTIKAEFHISWGEMAKRPSPPIPPGLVPSSYSTDHNRPYTSTSMPSLGDPLPEPYETMN